MECLIWRDHLGDRCYWEEWVYIEMELICSLKKWTGLGWLSFSKDGFLFQWHETLVSLTKLICCITKCLSTVSAGKPCIVQLVFLPFCNYRLLNHIAEINYSSESDELWKFLESIYNSSVPDPGRTLQIPFNDGRDVCTLFLFSLYVKHILCSSHVVHATHESIHRF